MVNRRLGLMFGRPRSWNPSTDLSAADRNPATLDLLAADFARTAKPSQADPAHRGPGLSNR